jgi:hypothetical protein
MNHRLEDKFVGVIVVSVLLSECNALLVALWSSVANITCEDSGLLGCDTVLGVFRSFSQSKNCC